ncbi:hypothetical protein [Tautonia plasticadhaerens]|uniref:Uncharacterized protein n=1 Tax=Tautonia plasticadhaerens TaxID=2527974 RepID=A0A518GW33_9BACT|nr:hypothetical protein [Tautonia plasticadhaerens]QDV32810.1 hypothetical protein ElP_06500 [Tautonia plasticadhaerens]
MKNLRLIDWMKLAPFALAAALLAGCGAPEGEADLPADDTIGAETSTDLGLEEPVIEEETIIDETVEPGIEAAPEEPGIEVAPEETPAP